VSTERLLMTLQETATSLKVSPHTVRKWVREGRLQPVRLCRRLLFAPASIDRLIAAASTAQGEWKRQ
jgi:excisionase family DNA binding protein